MNPKPTKAYVVMHADEAEYHGATGEIEAHGTVKLNFQNYAPSIDQSRSAK
jgi:hypothetical protein